MKASKHLIYIISLLFFLLACDNGSEQEKSPDIDSLPPVNLPSSLFIDIKSPWAVSASTAEDSNLLAAIDHSNGYLLVFSLQEDRSLQKLAKAEVGFHPDDVRWVDWDFDGKLESLLVSVEGEEKVQLWRWEDNELSLEWSHTVAYGAQTVAAADFDVDGKMDFVIGPYQGNQVTLYWNEGDNNFTEQALEAGKNPSYPRIADWDGDGDQDILWSDWHEGSIRLAENKSKRAFEVKIIAQVPANNRAREVAIGDLNGDAKPDLVVALELGKAVALFMNDGQGGVLSDSEQIPAQGERVLGYLAAAVSASEDNHFVALAEMDAMVLARRSSDNNNWELRRRATLGSIPQALQFIDIDRDGHLDLVFANSSEKGQIEIYFGPLWDTFGS